MKSTSERVLGTREVFMKKLQENPAEMKVAMKSIEKYQQKDGLPKVGDPMRDFLVRPLASVQSNEVKLADLISIGRPIVLNFGSCS